MERHLYSHCVFPERDYPIQHPTKSHLFLRLAQYILLYLCGLNKEFSALRMDHVSVI
jgi:hypothetical protein